MAPERKDDMPRQVLITGTSYGLGQSISRAVVDRGDRVFSLSRTPPPKESRESWTRTDLGDLDSLSGAIDSLASGLGDDRLDGVVLNAAVADKAVSQWDSHQVERHFRINALGPFFLWSELESRGLVADACNVVLLGSFLQNGNVQQPAYGMSKAALWSWMRSYTMAQPPGSAVAMNMIWPGRVITPANPVRELPESDPNFFYTPELVTEQVMRLLYQEPYGPRGTVLDMGRS